MAVGEDDFRGYKCPDLSRKDMILMGPAPKHPSARARTNRTSTAAVIKADPKAKVPELPARDWHPLTLQWWTDIWRSPMAPEFDDSDRHGLFALAVLVDDFWTADSPSLRMKLASEVRQQGQRFGLSPIDRRRLQWEIEKAEEAQAKGTRRRATRTPTAPAADPRAALRAL